MSWINFLDKIYVLNLTKRTDRLLQTTKDFEEFEIPFERVSAIEDNEQGARGLRDTMYNLFNDAIENNYEHILIFEDDCKIITTKEVFDETMEAVVKQLPDNYHMCFLGGQASHRFSHFHSANLLPVTMYFSTHSVIYSKQGIKEIMARDFLYPIDNWYVTEIEPLGHSYCVHPLLCSQYAGYSDIGRNEIDWEVFIVPRHAQKINEMRGKLW